MSKMMYDYFKKQEHRRAKQLKRVIKRAFLEGIKVGANREFDYCGGYETERQIWRNAKPYFDSFFEKITNM
jgi:hypothetical protein